MLTLLGGGQGQNDDGINLAFEFTVQTDNAGTSAANQFTIPITSATPYDISTSDGHGITGATGATTLTFSAPGTYTVSITESCEGWRFNNGGDKLKLLDIINWGVYANTATNSFYGASNMTCSATDKPTGVHTTLNGAFGRCTLFNGAIGNWDVSTVTDMAFMFDHLFSTDGEFNQDISSWDVSNVITFQRMFANCKFNQDISSWTIKNTGAVSMHYMFSASFFNQPLNDWDVSAVTDMYGMFNDNRVFNQDLNLWNTSNVTNMGSMFRLNPVFNGDISTWNTSSVTNMSEMFNSCNFNGDISAWNTSSVTNMSVMFRYCPMNSNISGWNVGNVTNMNSMFYGNPNFNQNIGSWNTSLVTNMSGMFAFTNNFNNGGDPSINNWNTSNVTSMLQMFYYALAFNQPIGNWDVSLVTGTGLQSMFDHAQVFNQDLSTWNVTSNVTSLSSTFNNARVFNSDISGWDVSSVTNMASTFIQAYRFNQDISGWNTSNVVSFSTTFRYALDFNQPIGIWNTSSATNMSAMLENTQLDQDLSSWDINQVTLFGNFKSLGAPLSTANYDALLVAWEAQAPQSGITISFGNSQYSLGSAAEAARTSLISTYGWTITDGGGIVNPMIITIDTTLGDGLNSYTLNFTGTGYDIETSDGQTITGATTATTINFAAPGTYDIEISGGVSTRSFINDLKLIDIKKWGSVDTPLAYAFGGANSLTTITAPDQPVNLNMAFLFRGAQNFVGGISHWNVSGVTDFSEAFYNTSFNEDISSWDTSSATNLNRMFRLTPFNNGGQPGINNWDVSNVANFSGMFQTCSSFNQPIGNWTIKTSGPVSMSNMFFQASAFNQPIDSWDVSAVTTMNNMFQLATSFNQDLNSWNLASVTNIINMFQQASAFNGNVSSWVFPNVTLFNSLFQQAVSFNQDISGWDTSNITGMYGVFRQATAFNQPIGSWDTSSVTTMASMFFEAEVFNQNINNWDTSSVVDMQYMFYGANAFNQPINFWDTSSVTNMQFMFYQMPFNKPIGMWDTSSLISIDGMFESNSAFNQDISNWNILSLNGSFTRFRRFGRDFDRTNYDELLVSWYNQLETAYPGGVGYPNTVTIDFRASQYSLGGDAEAARTALISTFGWTITDGGAVSNPFVFVVKTNNAGTSAADQFAFPLDASSTVNATVDWGDGNINTITAYNDPNATHTYAAAGTYTISVTGILNGWRFNNGGDRRKLLDVTQWGIFDMNLSGAFYGCDNLTGSWTDHPRIGNTMQQTFANCFSFTGDVSEFSTVGVTSVSGVLQLHYSQSIPNVSNWDVSSVGSFSQAFRETNTSGVDLSSWDVRNGTSMLRMFSTNFGTIPDLSMWKVAANITNRNQIFSVANMFGSRSYDYGFESWEVGKCNFDGGNLMTGANTMPQERYDSTLIAWSNNIGLGPQTFSSWGFGASNYTLGGAAEAARNNLINNYNFTFVDGGGINPNFEFTVNTAITGSGSTPAGTFQLPLVSTSTVNATVDWGDGTVNTVTSYNDPNATHTYPSSGTYNIKISGILNGWQFNNTGDKRKMANISNWGCFDWTEPIYVFSNCDLMTQTATDAPTISTTSMQWAFGSTNNWNGVVDNWDMSGVTNITAMFRAARAFNQPVNSWDTSSFTNTSFAFMDTNVFNQPLNNWDMSSVTLAQQMFSGAIVFNQDLSSWDISGVLSNNLQALLNGATSFNSPLNWSVINFNSVYLFLQNATSFDQSLASWNISTITSGTNSFMNGGGFVTPANYDATLVSWEAQAPPINKTWNFGNSQYTLGSAGETARASLISTYGWTILDGGGI